MDRLWFNYAKRTLWKHQGVNDSWIVETLSLGKEGSSPNDDHPYLVANEFVAANIAWFLRLPIPPFALMRPLHGKAMFTTLHVNPKRDGAPRDANPRRLVETDPRLCTGIILFDALIANIDRHAGNVLVDDPKAPKQIHVIDHDRSVFGHMGGDDNWRFTNLVDRLALNGNEQNCGLGAGRHCLLDWLNTAEHFNHWFGWIEAIPNLFIESICEEVIGLNITAEQARSAARFLKDRKGRISEIVLSNKEEFTKIKKKSWGLV